MEEGRWENGWAGAQLFFFRPPLSFSEVGKRRRKLAWQSACTTAHGWGLPPSPAGRGWRGVGDAECAGRGHGACPLLIRRRGGGERQAADTRPGIPSLSRVRPRRPAPAPPPYRAQGWRRRVGMRVGWGHAHLFSCVGAGRGVGGGKEGALRGLRDCALVSSLIQLFFFRASPSRTRSRSPRGGRPGVLSCSLRPPAPSSSLRSQVPARGKECARAQRETRHTLLSFFFDAERFQGAREGGVARPRAHAATGATGSQGDPLSACPGGKGHESADRARRALPFNPRRVRAAPKRKEKKTRSPS